MLVTTPILQPILSDLMENIGKAEALATSAHQTGYTPDQMERLNEAEVVIAPDKNIAPGLKKILDIFAKKGGTVIYLTDLKSAEALPYRHNNPFLESKNKKPKKPMKDPHIWLDPLRVANLLPELAGKIADYWPSSKESLNDNANRMALRLRAEVHPAISNIIAEAKQRHSDSSNTVPVLTYHDAYQYFQKRYGLEAGYIIQRPEDYTGAKTSQELLDTSNKTRVRCILSETDNYHAQRIANLAQADVVIVNPERPYTNKEVPHAPWTKNGYDRMLLAVAKAYAECL